MDLIARFREVLRPNSWVREQLAIERRLARAFSS
ncbi:MAG: hypothetical protein ACI9EP_000372 [Oceanospirillaceae bacterium]|jgi:hypothetical protein